MQQLGVFFKREEVEVVSYEGEWKWEPRIVKQSSEVKIDSQIFHHLNREEIEQHPFLESRALERKGLPFGRWVYPVQWIFYRLFLTEEIESWAQEVQQSAQNLLTVLPVPLQRIILGYVDVLELVLSFCIITRTRGSWPVRVAYSPAGAPPSLPKWWYERPTSGQYQMFSSDFGIPVSMILEK